MESYGTDDDTSSDRLYPGDSMEPTAPIAKVLSADERREQLRRRMEELERQESIKAVAKGKVQDKARESLIEDNRVERILTLRWYAR
mmetsp:Transcript_12809/g.44976  ORF Transcript_12809/g.44976 Transcript_12809/m.44976 type:complete len:87 (-) Transcript_12809:977-1237(-)